MIFRYLLNIFLSIDQLINSAFLGHPDESLSSRLGRSAGKERYVWVRYARIFVDFIFFFDTLKIEGRIIYHCKKSIMPLEQQNFREMIDYEIWSWNID